MSFDKPNFADTIWARLIALGIGVLVAWALYATWADEVRTILATGRIDALPTAAPVAVKPENPELAACLERRIGDVDQMLADGVIGEAQATAFKQRATDLCNAQNPL